MKINYFRYFSVIAFFVCISLHSFAQKTLVFGRVVERSTGSPVAFANIAFKGTTVGTSSDELGNFTLESVEPYSELTFSAIGYVDTTIVIIPNEHQEVRIKMRSADYTLNEVVINAGENPAFEILRKVIENKPKNDPQQLDAYEYRSYNKAQFDLNNFSDKIKKNFLFRPFPFIWEYQDSMANGVRYLPFLFKENVRNHYFIKNPTAYREYILGSQQAQFFRGPKIEKFIDELYLNPEIYENFIVILNKSFPSPINDSYKRFYKFILNDTSKTINGLNCHHIRFYPKGSSDVAFTGEMYIHDSTYAVVQMDLNFSIDANINFVRSFWIRMIYDWVNREHWFASEITVLADFTVVENAPELTGFFGRRYSQYKNVIINQPRPDSIYAPIEEVINIASDTINNSSFWENERSDSLTTEENNIFNLVDTIQTNWKFKVIKNSFTTIGSGWAPFKGYDIGNIFTFYSYNDIEGSRLKFGFKTPYDNEFPLQPAGYVAYGTRDDRWKYMGELNLKFNRRPGKHNLIGVSVLSDVDQLGRSYYTIPIDHFLTYFLQTAPFDTRTFIDTRAAYIERQWFAGMITRLSVFDHRVSPFGDYTFSEISDTGDRPVSNFNLAGLRFGGRFAFGEKETTAKFYDRAADYFMLKYPAFSVDYIYGEKGFLDSEFNYQRLNLRIEHQQRMNRWGYLSYIIEAGKVWGKVPYPYLAIPFGNQAILADRASFNMMNYLEFATDEYVAVHLEHHFDGLLFNLLHFNRILKLREFLIFKMYAGKLSEKNNQEQWRFPDRLFVIDEPYLEAGFGIENILKLARVDFTWRLNYLDHPDIYRFLPKPSFQFRF